LPAGTSVSCTEFIDAGGAYCTATAAGCQSIGT
jgi:hypothetical protein